MRKFLTSFFLFSSIAFTLILALSCLHLPDDYLISKTKGTAYEKIAWNLHLINQSPEKIKGASVFIGPSLIQTGICDSTLQASGINAVNLGTNGAGNEAEYFFLKRIASLQPKQVFIHLYKDDHRALHNMTPLLYSTPELLESGQDINYSFFTFLFKRAAYSMDFFLWNINRSHASDQNYAGKGVKYEESPYKNGSYALIAKHETDDFFESVHLPEKHFVKDSEAGRFGLVFAMVKWRRYLIHYFSTSPFFTNTVSQKKFDQNEIRLCESKNIPVKHLYMPVIADAKIGKPFGNDFFRGNYHDVVSLQDFKFLDSGAYWADMTHLSREGAIAFSKAIVEQKILE